MIDKGLDPEFSPAVARQLAGMSAAPADPTVRDLRALLWSSIDNDDSKDLDQLTVAEDLGGGRARLLVAVADVDALVKQGTPIDQRAEHNTTSVYTPAVVFHMLPAQLSTDLTSLNEGVERLALVMDMTVDADGTVSASDVYRARVTSKAQLTYNAVGSWLDGKSAAPDKVAATAGLAENLKLQDRAADALRKRRHDNGALDLDTIEPRAVMRDGEVVDLQQDPRNNAKMLIEDAMIASNGVTARLLSQNGWPSLRRIVRSPKRWDRIAALALELGEKLPGEPDSKALEAFLLARKKADPLRFPDLSLAVVKAMGAGEYAVELPGETPTGHFGLAVRDYSHSTAPNRRFPDLITHRLLKALLAGEPQPYSNEALVALAAHCTLQEDAANKVERQMIKSAAASLLESKIGQRFEGIVTGASQKGTWVRIFRPPVEGRVVRDFDGLDIGQRIAVKLLSTNVEKGFIDFARAH